LKEHVILGTKSTVLPGITINTGTRIGAHSLVNQDLDPWVIYGGTPVKKIGEVNKEQVLTHLNNFTNNITRQNNA
jgi:galactoside O-acetyltransferase